MEESSTSMIPPTPAKPLSGRRVSCGVLSALHIQVDSSPTPTVPTSLSELQEILTSQNLTSQKESVSYLLEKIIAIQTAWHWVLPRSEVPTLTGPTAPLC